MGTATLPAGTVAVREGEAGELFHLIVAGSAAGGVRGEPRPALAPGDCFGEIALLRDIPRTATVVADQHLRTLALDRETFLVAVTGNRMSSAAADALVTERLTAGPGGPTGGRSALPRRRLGEADVQDEVSEPNVQDSTAGPVHDERQPADGQDHDHQPEEEHDDSRDGVPGYRSRSSHGLQLPVAARLIPPDVSFTTASMACRQIWLERLVPAERHAMHGTEGCRRPRT